MRELFHPALLPGVAAHPAKPTTPGQEQTCQFVTPCSSGPARLIERDGGTCVLLVAPQRGTTVILAKRQHRWLLNCSSGNCQSFSGDIQWKIVLCCQGCCAVLCNHLATSVVLNQATALVSKFNGADGCDSTKLVIVCNSVLVARLHVNISTPVQPRGHCQAEMWDMTEAGFEPQH